MTAIWQSLIAVFGTLAGAALVSALHARTAHATTRTARLDTRRAEMLTAVAALTSALADHRRAMWVREDLRLSGASPERYAEARAASHATRSAVTAPLTMVVMLAPNLTDAACAACQAAYGLRGVTDRAALDAGRITAIAAVDELVATAGRWVAELGEAS